MTPDTRGVLDGPHWDPTPSPTQMGLPTPPSDGPSAKRAVGTESVYNPWWW